MDFFGFFDCKIEKHDNSGSILGSFLHHFGIVWDHFWTTSSFLVVFFVDFLHSFLSAKIDRHDYSGSILGSFLDHFCII